MSQPATNSTFYEDLPAMQHIREITESQQYQPAPQDWLVAVTDVINSTGAIREGKYKSVNTCAAATITALFNSIPDTEVPFLFGGDGAAVLVPPQVRQTVADTLVAVRRMAKASFELELRVGLIPLRDILAAGYTIRVGKLRLSDHFQQPVFMGGGLEYAESLLRNAEKYPQYQLPERGDETADFSGFECRWSKHKARSEEVVSLLIKAVHGDAATQREIYISILDEIQRIYGERDERHPISLQRMRVALSPAEYQYEVTVKNPQASWRDTLRLMFWSVAGFLRWRFVDRIWESYKKTVYQATDHEKFDDMLRMTISGTAQQRQALREYLDVWRNTGDVVYGMHVSGYALMTCIVFDRFGRQVHFLDADDGGYAMAAQELKSQIKERGYNAETAFSGFMK